MQKVELELEDDLTGGPADESITFGVDGRTYEIDLSAKHAAALRGQLARFIQHARMARPRRSRAAARTVASRERSRQIREWAGQQGFAVAEHGRLPTSVVQEYEIGRQTEPPPMSGARQAVRNRSTHLAGKGEGRSARARRAETSSRRS